MLAEEVLHEVLRLGTESALRVVLAGESPLADRIAQIAGDGGDAGLVRALLSQNEFPGLRLVQGYTNDPKTLSLKTSEIYLNTPDKNK